MSPILRIPQTQGCGKHGNSPRHTAELRIQLLVNALTFSLQLSHGPVVTTLSILRVSTHVVPRVSAFEYASRQPPRGTSNCH